MPRKFATKTIETILDPVAQQVSQLMILYEEAQGGRVTGDLSTLLEAVGAAVQNLVQVGKSMLQSSKDEILKKEMPPAIAQVENSATDLSEAGKGLKLTPQSTEHQKMLLNGCRGLLNGVADMLVSYDESEVRKIVKSCRGVQEYLKVAEVVQSMEDLVTFTKNLTPGTAAMTKAVEGRSEELNNRDHAAMLDEEVDSFKTLTTLLLSSMKSFVTFRKEGQKGADEAQENRNYYVQAMVDSIDEMIRVLEMFEAHDELIGSPTSRAPGALPGSFEAKLQQAMRAIAEYGKTPEANRAGIIAITNLVEEARSLAKSLNPKDRSEIEKLCDEIDALKRELENETDDMRREALKIELSEKLNELEQKMRKAMAWKVAEDFKTPLGPLNALTEAAKKPLDAPKRDENYSQCVSDFKQHAANMASTATAVAKSGVISDRRQLEAIERTVNKVKKQAPQVVLASRMLFDNPDSEEAKKHYDVVKEEYEKQVKKLTKLMDETADTVEFLGASEELIRAELDQSQAVVKTDSQAAFKHVSNAAHLANRVVTFTQVEVDNNEDEEAKKALLESKERVTAAIAPMIQSARAAITNTSNEQALADFSQNSDNLVEAVHNVKELVERQRRPPTPEEVPPRPPTPVDAPPPRPPSPDDVMEMAPPLQSANPIGFAAHQLHQDAKNWEEKDNDMVSAAKRMARLMMQMAKFARGEEGGVQSKKELIMTARLIAKESEAVTAMARKVAAVCTDKRMKNSLLQIVDKLPTIGTQLKIIASVKATTQGGDDETADREASEMLTGNAQNLMQAVSEVLFATEAATIRVSPENRAALGLKWVKTY